MIDRNRLVIKNSLGCKPLPQNGPIGNVGPDYFRSHFLETVIMKPLGLPVDAVLGDLRRALSQNPNVILEALPGAGKTTGVPLALLDAPWFAGQKMIVLAPRRLAARAAAARMSRLLNEDVGRTVGYRVRMDSRVGPETRIEVVTEGVLTRMLQKDPSLKGVGLVAFDEFHERNLDGDLGLALCLDIQGVLNPRLKLLVMSATLEKEPVSALLKHAPVITCPGRLFPVETRYVGPHTPGWSEDAVYGAVLSAVRENLGGILVFLPGAGEIRKMARRLKGAGLGHKWRIAPLFGNLSRESQDLAILPPPENLRKIVLATSIAETSLTIEGIRVVVDSGLQRRPRFDPRSGLTRLVTVPASRASADQRRGRAGRTAPGLCLRLWSEQMHGTLAPTNRPEIVEADLSGLVLELAAWGVDDSESLRWLDSPPKAAFEQARSLLKSVEALDGEGRATPHGLQMMDLPVHPRLAHMLLRGKSHGLGTVACDVAALLTERDVVRFDQGLQDADMRLRVDLVRAGREGRSLLCTEGRVDEGAVSRVVRVAGNLRRRLGIKRKKGEWDDLGRLLAWAYPDRIVQLRTGFKGKFLLNSGRGAFLEETSSLASEPFLVAAELDGKGRNARIYKAAPYDLDTLMKQFQKQLVWSESITWDHEQGRVKSERNLKLGAITLRSEPLTEPDPEELLKVLLDGIRDAGIECLPWTKELRRWQGRVSFLRKLLTEDDTWPDVSDQGLESTLDQWLGSYLLNMDRLSHLARVDLKNALFGMLSYRRQKTLDALAPTHFTVPSGSRIPIDYDNPIPILAVRLQEMFGLTATPTVAGGRQPLLIHLLSPAGRPVQITQDLAGFWQNGYHAVKKELKGRYPKHYWPDDPLKARATARVKPKRR
ncbi:ATP-dependent helicase HrpB [delta proteobacterium NaphS2]|nr:ATP-dependent helicase HrpB [delta proteobacterium NaphS2]